MTVRNWCLSIFACALLRMQPRGLTVMNRSQSGKIVVYATS